MLDEELSFEGLWHARLDGEDLDFHAASQSFPSGDHAIVHLGFWRLRSTLFEGLEASLQLRATAEEVLEFINGFVASKWPTFRPLSLQGQFHNGTTSYSPVLLQATDMGRSFDTATLTVNGETSAPPDMSAVVELARKEQVVREVLRFRALELSTPQSFSWFILYKILELVKTDCGSLRKVSELSSVDEGELKLLKGTANNVSASGDAARHSSAFEQGRQPMQKAMSLDRGREVISRVVDSWVTARLRDMDMTQDFVNSRKPVSTTEG